MEGQRYAPLNHGKPWVKGYLAYGNGLSSSDCPYDGSTKNSQKNAKAWRHGYDAAIQVDDELRNFLDMRD